MQTFRATDGGPDRSLLERPWARRNPNEKRENMKKAIGATLAASVAAALVACAGNNAENAPAASTMTTSAKVQCKESNSCKGNGSCAGVAVNEKHTCKGQNACGGNLREISKEECDSIKGSVVAAK